jgi:hypothetical protein
MSLAWIIFSHP